MASGYAREAILSGVSLFHRKRRSERMRCIGSVCTGAAVALGLLLGVPAAFAQNFPREEAAPLEGHLRRGFGTSESTNWSGYAAYQATFTSAQGSWTEPTANCESTTKHHYTLAAFWVGLDGYEDNTVEQTGTEADCVGGTPIYGAWWELYPKSSVAIAEPVEPGNQMHARVSQDELVLEDLTRGWKIKQSYLPGSLAFDSAEWIAEAPARNALTSFGSVHFSRASASSDALSDGAIESSAWSNEAITLVSGGGHSTELATPGSLEEEARAFTIGQKSTTGSTQGNGHGHSH